MALPLTNSMFSDYHPGSISEAVEGMLDKHWDWKLPVDIKNIASKCNINALYLNEIEDPTHIGLSGLAEIKNEERFIYCSMSEIDVRQRFTLAHELGHHILGHVTPENPMKRDDSSSFRSNSVAYMEREANQFAAELLMPKVALDHYILKKQESNIASLASKFQVSQVAMRYRLKNLGYLDL